jgi:hypothetical protein
MVKQVYDTHDRDWTRGVRSRRSGKPGAGWPAVPESASAEHSVGPFGGDSHPGSPLTAFLARWPTSTLDLR